MSICFNVSETSALSLNMVKRPAAVNKRPAVRKPLKRAPVRQPYQTLFLRSFAEKQSRGKRMCMQECVEVSWKTFERLQVWQLEDTFDACGISIERDIYRVI